MPAPVIAILNMKGGVGKTTISAHVSREIFEAKRASVLLIDLDPQFNLTQQLLERHAYNTLIAAKNSVMRLFEPLPAANFFDVMVDSTQPPPASQVLTTLLKFSFGNATLSIIPGVFELTKYSFISDTAKLKYAQDYFRRFISQARNEFSLIVLDMNPSSSFLTLAGLCVATDIVSPVRPDKYSMLGLELVKQLLDHDLVANKPNMHIVMNGISRSNPVTETERQILKDAYFSTRLLSNRLYETGLLRADTHYTGFASDKKVPHRTTVKAELRKVGLEICQRVGL